MSVCYECQQSTSGSCWRHRNAPLVNSRPVDVPPPLPRFGPVIDVAAVIRERDEARAELERLREAIATMTIWSKDGTPRYRTPDNIPQTMPPHVEKAVRELVPVEYDGVACTVVRSSGDGGA